MTDEEFNRKWSHCLPDGRPGAHIGIPEVLDYLDAAFEKELMVNPDFEYRQIKLKFGTCRIYCNSDKRHLWQETCDRMLVKDDQHPDSHKSVT